MKSNYFFQAAMQSLCRSQQETGPSRTSVIVKNETFSNFYTLKKGFLVWFPGLLSFLMHNMTDGVQNLVSKF